MLFGNRRNSRAISLQIGLAAPARQKTPPRTVPGDIDDTRVTAASSTVVSERAKTYFDRGYNCAQSVLMASSDVLGMEVSPELIRGMASFTGGIGYSGCTCGALVGASVIAGMLTADDKRPRRNRKATDISGKLHDKFKDCYKTTCCRALRKGRDFSDKETRSKCKDITARTAELLIETVDGSILRTAKGRALQ